MEDKMVIIIIEQLIEGCSKEITNLETRRINVTLERRALIKVKNKLKESETD